MTITIGVQVVSLIVLLAVVLEWRSMITKRVRFFEAIGSTKTACMGHQRALMIAYAATIIVMTITINIVLFLESRFL